MSYQSGLSEGKIQASIDSAANAGIHDAKYFAEKLAHEQGEAVARAMSSALTPKQKLMRISGELNKKLIERSGEIECCMCALLTRQHVLMVGTPGTGKSLLVDSIVQAIVGCDKFEIEFHKELERDFMFGPVSLKSMMDDELKRLTAGYATDAHIISIDEVFNASPAVHQQLHGLFHERVVKEGLTKIKCKVESMFCASNHWCPEGQEANVQAFFDRLLFRKATVRVSAAKRHNLIFSSAADRTPFFDAPLTLDELHELQAETQQVQFSDLSSQVFMQIVDELEKEGIKPSDRRLIQSFSACQAMAVLNGNTEVQTDDLEILKHVLWDDPIEQPQKCAAVVAKLANPIGAAIATRVMEIDEQVDKMKARGADMSIMLSAKKKIQQVCDELGKMPKENQKAQIALEYAKQQSVLASEIILSN